jgi:RNA polymerase sigma factor (sigma-70 family)
MSFIRSIDPDQEADEVLVQRFKGDGDLHTLALLYQRYMDLVYGVCLKYLKEPEPARDAVMQIFEVVSVKLRAHEVTHFRAWLHTLARNHCLMHLRSAKNLSTTPLDPALMQSGDSLHLNGATEKEMQLEWMEDCLEALAEGQREAVRMFYLEEKCYKEISEQTGQAWNQVRSLIQNGRRNLRNCMEMKEKESNPENKHN